MNRFHIPGILSAAVLALAPLAQAQFSENRYSPDAVTSLKGRLQEYLDHAYRVRHISGSDHAHMNHTDMEFRELAV